MEKNRKRRSGIRIMGKLIGLVRPLLHVMAAAVILGVAGYLCAIFLTALAGAGLLNVMGLWEKASLTTVFVCLAAAAVLRGVLHYGEQACNHYIAFKLLALIRHKVFAVLRKLCPAKLDGRDKGNLISIITSDIELLEVFYAHTISPIMIAVFTSLIMEIFFFHYHVLAGLFALAGYVAVGVIVPVWNSGRGASCGMEFRECFGDLNSFVLESLRGLDETIQYQRGKDREEEMVKKSRQLDRKQKIMKDLEGTQRGVTNTLILLFSFGMLFLTAYLCMQGQLSFEGAFLCTILMMGSFGPVTALSGLSNNLMQTLASGERVLSLLEEEPQIGEVSGQEHAEFGDVSCSNLDFAYEDEQILKDYSIRIPKGSRIGIHGRSGSGKSTLLKLLMRFYDPQRGEISIGERGLVSVNTKELREMESYVTQETDLFHDSIANNIAVAKPGASREEIEEAAKKAALHEFILSLPKGYDTQVGELGDTLSGGERQRIGIARAFLHDAPMLLLDEPTSNLDSLNEGIILKSIRETCQDKTVVIVSHRESTMAAAEKIYEMENGRLS
ncbi:ABC transporter ATP-binding protein [Lachnoclostridium sp. An169]|uniref:amino acid ABC transporter ATP-binding/permease protein n=1 Tax=Lachnoclostridium sp. An169 TaxID=1965569 RepID=UPI000B370F5F|nr:ABC transporter ATP-binding protein [Lachnoclostridium sp. An169]OUP85361.1 ABC transporter ATP-binding protein [Lachnoclostridium sp. An169]